MGSVATLPLDSVVDVSVTISPSTPATPSFNKALIVGTSPVIGSVTGLNPRIRLYTSLAQIASDGFATNSPEYTAASIYFSQSPAPLYLYIGRQDLTSIGSLDIGAAGGTNYAVGDEFTVTQVGAHLGRGIVTTVAAGVVTGVDIVKGFQGTGYSVANNLSTVALSGTGAGLTVDILAIGETPLQAVNACRIAVPDWYLVAALAALDADNIAIGEWAQAQQPQCVYFYTTGTTQALSCAAGTVFAALKAGTFSRAMGFYATTMSGLAPNNIYAAVAAMGVAMGLNTGLDNSYFTMKFKALVGINVQTDLTQTDIARLEAANANVYLSFANSYTWMEQGVVASGSFFDEILNLDMLGSDMQFSVVDLLVSNPAIFQTQAGQTQILNAINGACARSAARGFISGGIWEGQTLSGNGLSLTPGQSIPNGYLAQSANYSSQSTADRKARKGMPVYVAIIESGAVHSLVIGVLVQQ